MTSARKSPLKAVKQVFAKLVPGSDTEEELNQKAAQLAAKLDTNAAEIARLDSRRGAFLQDFERVRAPGSKEAAEKLAADIEAARSRHAEIEQELAEVRGKLAEMTAEKESEAATERIRKLARDRNEYDQSAQRVQKLAEQLAEALHSHGRVGRALADRLEGIESIEARRSLHSAAIDARARTGLFRLFCLAPPVGDAPFNPDQWRWLRWPVNNLAPERRSFLELERDALDELVGFFLTRPEAERARHRIDPSGNELHVVRDDAAMVFRLARYKLAGDYSAADAAPGGQDRPA